MSHYTKTLEKHPFARNELHQSQSKYQIPRQYRTAKYTPNKFQITRAVVNLGVLKSEFLLGFTIFLTDSFQRKRNTQTSECHLRCGGFTNYWIVMLLRRQRPVTTPFLHFFFLSALIFTTVLLSTVFHP